VKRINPLYLLIALNVLLVLFRDWLLPAETTAAIAARAESVLTALGPFGHAGLVVAIGICGFFFLPFVLPLCLLAGALYGPWVGTAVGLAGLVLSTVTSTLSVRHVLTGMQRMIDKRPKLKGLIASTDRHVTLVIVMVRFAIIVPPLLQNIALALTKASVTRLALVTVVASIPAAAIYAFLGAGLVAADKVTDLALYLALPVLLLLALSASLAWFKSRLGDLAD
jgi:uncharacterized membrane protein YdjX (TVP38/TMEM64 family)